MNLNTVIRGEGQPVFFQHGLGGDNNQVLHFLSGIEKCKIISTDLAGHGKSPFTGLEDVSFDQFADSVISVADKLNIEAGIFGGISMGASIALNIALRYPGRVQALIIIRPAWLDKPHPVNLEPLFQLGENSRSVTNENIHIFPYFNTLFKNYPYLKTVSQDLINNNHSSLIGGLFQQIINDTPVKDIHGLQSIGIPTLILASKDDFLHPLEIARSLHENLTNVIYRELPSRYRETQKFECYATRYIQQFLSEWSDCTSRHRVPEKCFTKKS